MSIMLENLRVLWAEHDWIVWRILAAFVIGLLVGLEREFRDKPAGLRTMILICLGACVFTMVSLVMGGPDAEKTRIAAQIVTGVGFLGAGSILRSTRAVYGLTTAAGIWMVSALGMACGFGEFAIALAGLVAMMAVLLLLHPLTHRIDASRQTRKFSILSLDPNLRFADFETLFAQAGLKTLMRNCHRDAAGFHYTFRVRGTMGDQLALREKLLRMENLQLRK